VFLSLAGASKKSNKTKKNKAAGDIQGDEEGGKDGAGKIDTLALSQQIASLSVAANSLEVFLSTMPQNLMPSISVPVFVCMYVWWECVCVCVCACVCSCDDVFFVGD